MKRWGIIVMLVALVLPCSLGWAQDSTGTSTTTTTTTTYNADRSTRNSGVGIGFGPLIGLYKTTDADAMRLTGGVALRAKLSPAFAIEGSITYRQEEFAGGAVKVRSWPIMATAMLYPLPIVYGLLGAGWYNTTLDFDASKVLPGAATSDTQQKFGWHFGGGVELPLGGATLFGDIRYVFLNYDWKNFPGTGGTNANFYVISAGILFGL